MTDAAVPVSRSFVYRLADERYDCFSDWIGWLRPEGVFSDVTPEQEAKYQDDTADDEVLDEQAIDKLRMCDWHAAWAEIRRAAAAAGWDGTISHGPRLCTAPLRGLVYGWADMGGVAWYVSHQPMPWIGQPAMVVRREVGR